MSTNNSCYALIACLFVVMLAVVFSAVRQFDRLQLETDKSKAELVGLQQDLDLLRSDLENIKIQAALSDSEAKAETKHPARTSVKLKDITLGESVNSQSAFIPETEVAEAKIQETDFEKGKRALAKGFYQTAINYLEKVSPESEEYIESRMDMARAKFFSGQYKLAAEAYEEILKLEPQSVEALIGLANTYNRTGDRGEQIAAFTKAISLEPEQWLHYNSRGSALYQNGDFDKAIDDFIQAGRLAIHSRTDQGVALENIGLVHLSRQRWLTAFQHTTSVNNIDASRSWNWLIRGIAALKLSYSHDAWLAFENWYKYRRPTDPFLIKQFLPGSLQEFAELTPDKVARLIDPPALNGMICVNDAQCGSRNCAAGAPDNSVNYCAESKKDCGANEKDGFKVGQKVEIAGQAIRCYRTGTGSGRWTVDDNPS